MEQHALTRTNAKGEPLIGTCMKCGRTGLTMDNFLHDLCKNPSGTTAAEAVLRAINDHEGNTEKDRSDG